MSDTKFTPGPWMTKRINTTGGSPGHSDFGSVVVIGKDEIIVKHHSMFYKVLVTKAPEHGPHAVNSRRSSDDPGTPDYNESKCINGIHPDAHLIAAAPDLFEALKMAAAYEEIRFTGTLSDEYHSLIAPWIETIEREIGEDVPHSERFPGWHRDAMYLLCGRTRDAALAKARGVVA